MLKIGLARTRSGRASRISSWKPFVLAACAFGLLIALGGFLYSREEYQNALAVKLREITAIGSLKAGQIEQWRSEFLSDALIASRSPLIVNAVIRLSAHSSDAAVRASLSDRLGLYSKYGDWEEVAAYGLDGSRLDAAPAGAAGLDAEAMRITRETLADGAPKFRDLYKRENGGYSVDILAPLQVEAGRAVGVLVMRKDPAKQLFPLIQSWPIPSRSSETLLVRREGERVVWLNTLRFSDSAPLSLSSPLTERSVPAVAAALGRIGSFSGVDYRGVPVVADLRQIKGSPWFIVAKIDSSEALREARGQSLAIVASAFGLFVIAVAILAFFHNRRIAAAYRSLYGEEKRRAELHAEFRATLLGIGDGVISTDIEGRIRWINAVAERLTGWPEAEARGRPLREVFRIYNEESGLEVPNPVGRVLHTGGIVGLARRTILASRDGTERAIADSGAPIKGDDGSIQGIVLVFRDISAERNAEAKARRLSAIVERSLNEILVFDASSLRIVYANQSALSNLGYGAEELASMTPLDVKPDFTAERLEEILGPLRSGRSETVTVVTRNRRKDGSTYDVYLSIQLHESREGSRFVSIGLDFSERRMLEEKLRRSLVERETLLRELHHRTKNNLQVVSSLIALEASNFSDPGIRSALDDMECRVQSMALAHELLYESDSLSRIELGPYLESIMSLALQSRDLVSKVRLFVDAAPIETSLDVASPIGLAVNELATNSAKYAFPDGQGGSIHLAMSLGEGHVRLEYGDDGVGLPSDFIPGEEGHLGLTLVNSLIERQLHGSFSIGAPGGFNCAIDFDLPGLAGAAAQA
jgi:PAS domain S-box-containing protein